MAIQFPANPQVGDPPFTDPTSGESWVWDGTKWNLQGGGDVDVLWEQNGDDIFYNNGNVGVGTNAPKQALDVVGQVNLPEGNAVIWDDGTAGATQRARIFGNANSELVFTTGSGGTRRATIDSAGRLLVGTNSSTVEATAVFQGTSGSATTAPDILLQRGVALPPNTGNMGRILFANSNGEDGARIAALTSQAWTDSAHGTNLQFFTTPNGSTTPEEQVRIDNAGNAFIGINRGVLDSTNFGTRIGVSESGGFNPGFISTFRAANAANPVIDAGGTEGRARIMGDGDLENTNNRYDGLSDIKLKRGIVDASSQWDDVKSIQVRNYELIANPGRKHIGVVAQELESICPGLVSERVQNEETGETAKAVAYSILYMKAFKALQEAMERIETLEARLAKLEGGASKTTTRRTTRK